MNLSSFISNTKFRFIKPDTPMNRWGLKIVKLLNILGIPFEFPNTLFPENDHMIKKEFRKIYNVPKMSTLAIGGIINAVVSQMPKDQVFVNVGIWNGFTFFSGLLSNADKKCAGVDNFSEFNGDKVRKNFIRHFNNLKSENHSFYEMDYKNYFKEIHKGSIGFYIYDGEHSYHNQFDGLKLAEPFFSGDCTILVDDVNKKEPRTATLDFINQSKNKYKIIFDAKTACNGHPTWWNGIIIIQRLGKF